MKKAVYLCIVAISLFNITATAQWATNATSIFPEDTTKKVGIGTSVPAYNLDIRSSIDNFRQLRISSPGSPLIKLSGSYNGGDGAEWYQSTAGDVFMNINSGAVGLFIKSNSAIGIGTINPQAKLDVNGGITIQNNNNLSWGGSYGPGIPTIASAINSGIYFYPAGTTSGVSMFINKLGNIGIGAINPQAKLDVNGNIKISDGTQGFGKVLTSDANGVATWQAPNSGWSLTGNAGTVDGTHFIGTTDDVPFNIRVNNQKAGRIDNLNTFYGLGAGNANTTGTHNTASGTNALLYNTVGGYNTANGVNALGLNTTGNYNTANGVNALNSNTTGYSNTASGSWALNFNTTGHDNMAIGFAALYSNTTGNFNAASGVSALRLNTTGEANTASGYYALFANTKGNQNTASGSYALASNTEGNSNTAVGGSALLYNTTGSNNTALGANALYNNTMGSANTAVGKLALHYNTTGNYNTAAGVNALGLNTTGNYNTANGVNALFANTDGSYNTAVGHSALQSNTTGKDNLALGFRGLFSNTNGIYNIAVGNYSLVSNTLGNYNTANGYSALFKNDSGSYNAAIGLQSLYFNTKGCNNMAGGSLSLYKNTTGNYNTASGMNALYSNTTGSYNTALGYNADVEAGHLTNATAIGANAKALRSNSIQLGDDKIEEVIAGANANTLFISGKLQLRGGSPGLGKILTSDAAGVASWENPTALGWSLTGNTGTVDDGTHFIGTIDNVPFNIRVNNQKAGRIDANNAFYGSEAGALNGSGGYGVAIGKQSLYNNTTGDGNIAIGYSALKTNNTGSYNTAIGYSALNANNTGSYNTAIGYNANTASGSLTNATAIGYGAIVNASNKIRLGEGVTVIEGSVMFTPSDGRFKTSINEADVKGLAFIKKLRPVVYNFDTKKFQSFLTQNMPADVRQKYMDKDFSVSTAIRQSGFIAQEVEKAAQEVGYDFNGIHKPENANDNYSLAYSQFVVPLVKAVQEQQTQIEEQQKVNKELQQQVKDQQKINDQLQQQIDELKKLIKGSNTLASSKTSSESSSEALHLFPNPTSGVFTVTAEHINSGVIEVHNMAGNLIKQVPVKSKLVNYVLDFSGYAKGNYIVMVNAGGKKYTKQIVVQ